MAVLLFAGSRCLHRNHGSGGGGRGLEPCARSGRDRQGGEIESQGREIESVIGISCKKLWPFPLIPCPLPKGEGESSDRPRGNARIRFAGGLQPVGVAAAAMTSLRLSRTAPFDLIIHYA